MSAAILGDLLDEQQRAEHEEDELDSTAHEGAIAPAIRVELTRLGRIVPRSWPRPDSPAPTAIDSGRLNIGRCFAETDP
jgi:hypothetical protein